MKITRLGLAAITAFGLPVLGYAQGINLDSQVHGTLPINNGGTGTTVGAIPAQAPTVYSNTVTYGRGQLVFDSANNVYIALGTTTGNSPTTGGSNAYWGLFVLAGTGGSGSGSTSQAQVVGYLVGQSINPQSLVVSGTTATVGGQPVCLENGTNCPAGNGGSAPTQSQVTSVLSGATVTGVTSLSTTTLYDTGVGNGSAVTYVGLAANGAFVSAPTPTGGGNESASALASTLAGNPLSLSSITDTGLLNAAYVGTNGNGQLVSVTAPAGGSASAAGNQYSVQYAATSGGNLGADNAIQVGTDHSVITAGPRVNVRDYLFANGWTVGSTTAASCAGVNGNTSGYADPTDTYNSICAVQSAALYASTLAANGVVPILYFPAGHYKVSQTGYTGVIVFTQLNVDVQGDSRNSTILENDSLNSALITFNGTFQPEVNNITLSGGASTIQTTGSLIESISSNSGSFHNFLLENNAGIGFNAQAATERTSVHDFSIQGVNKAIMWEGNANESYIDHCNIAFDGSTGAYSYDINATNGVEKTSGNVYPDPRPEVDLNSDNVHVEKCSIKGTRRMGIRISSTDSSVMESYFEADNSNTQDSGAGSVEVVGKQELGHLTSAMTTSGTTMSVDDAMWQPCYMTDPGLYASATSLNGPLCNGPDYEFGIFPADYLFGSTASSTAVSGLTRGQYELVVMGGFTGDGVGHIITRALQASGSANAYAQASQTAGNGVAGFLSAGFAWPTGSIVERIPPSGYGTATIWQNHLNMIHYTSSAGVTLVCSDTAFQPSGWVGNPSELCKDIYMGAVPDGYAVPFPTAPTTGTYAQTGTYFPPALDISFGHNSVYDGTTTPSLNAEQLGQGEIMLNNAYLNIVDENFPVSGLQGTNTAFTAYNNNHTHVNFQYGTNGYVSDDSAEVRIAVQGGVNNNFNAAEFGAISIGDNGNSFFNKQEVMNTGTQACTYVNMGATGAPGTGSFRQCMDGYGGVDFNGYNTTTKAWVPDAFVNINGFSYSPYINGYQTSLPYTVPTGMSYIQTGNSSAGTITLPPVSYPQYLTVLQGGTGAVSFQVQQGTASVAPVIYSGGTTISSGGVWTPGLYNKGQVWLFVSDGANYQLLTPIGTTKTCTTYPTVVNGVVTSC